MTFLLADSINYCRGASVVTDPSGGGIVHSNVDMCHVECCVVIHTVKS